MLLLMAEIRRSPVEVGSLSHYLQGFIHPRWCRISSINSSDYRCDGEISATIGRDDTYIEEL